MERVILLTGFGPFGGERINPSWEVAERFEGKRIGGAVVKTLKLPVHCKRAARQVMETVERIRPAAVIGLGQAGGRPALSLEKVAVNLADEHAAREAIGVANGKPVVTGGPDAYFSRLPLASILQALRRRNIPVELSLSAGVYVCNSVMYATLHALRRRPRVPAGFIHLPYEAAQAAHHRAVASMTLDLMAAGVGVVLGVVARRLS